MTITETFHAGWFLASEANGFLSREKATVISGQVLVAGQVVKLNGTKLTAHTGAIDSNLEVTAAAVGIMLDNVDATDGDVADCVYIARLAEVKDAAITYKSGGAPSADQKAAVQASLALLNIVAR